MSTSRNFLLGLFWAAAAILVWSGSLILLRVGVTTGLTAYDLTALRYAVAAVVLLPVLLRTGWLPQGVSARDALLMVILFGAPYVLLLSLAVKTAPAAAAGALNPGVMAMASVFIARMRGGTVSAAGKWGVAATGLGIGMFVLDSGGLAIGYLVLLLTGVMWAAYTAFVGAKKIPALHATALIAVGSAVAYLPVYATLLPSKLAQAAPADLLLQAAFQGVLVTSVAVYAFSRSAELLGPIVGSSLPALIPVVTLALDMLVMGRMPPVSNIAAACMVTLGIALVLLAARRRDPARS